MKRLLIAVLLIAQVAWGQTAKYPGAIATDADLFKAKDRSGSQLTAGIDNVTLSIPVADGTKFVAYELVTIDDEQMVVCSVAGNTLNICSGTRGFDWTNPASHNKGAAVRGQATAWHHNALAAEVKAIETALGANLANVAAASHAHAATDITSGTLASARGGTGSAYFGLAGPTQARTYTFPDANSTVEVQANKNQASGYAGLDGSSKLADAQLAQSNVTQHQAALTLAASQITSGALPLVRGGTNQASWTGGRCVQVNSGGTALESAAAACGTGGADTQFQYNNAGVLGGTAGFTWNVTDGRIVFSNAPPADATKAAWLFGAPLVGGNAAGTYIGVNAGSTYAGDFARFQLDGVTYAYLSNTGWFYAHSGLQISGTAQMGWSNRSQLWSDSDSWVRISNNAGTARGSLDLAELKHASSTEGTCDVSNRGRVVMVQGGTGVADTYRICSKDSGDAYAWRALY